jgi:diketogulonate reductase-like aldo/keto reductase
VAPGEPAPLRSIGGRDQSIHPCVLSTHERPTSEKVTEFLRIVSDPAAQPVNVHCLGGRHRTGVMTALYRMTQEGWTAGRAFKEMKQYEFGPDCLQPEFKKFVYDYRVDPGVTGAAGAASAATKAGSQAGWLFRSRHCAKVTIHAPARNGTAAPRDSQGAGTRRRSRGCPVWCACVRDQKKETGDRRQETGDRVSAGVTKDKNRVMPSTEIRTVALPSGEAIPALGQGTWAMGVDRKRKAEEIAALRLGLDLGMTVIDTAEMYAEGGAEEVVGEAIEGRRGEVFLVSKVLPHHATRRGTIAACHASLKRLRTGQLDLYLLHWRGNVPLAETLEAFDALTRSGDVRHWGVSNFDTSDMEELAALPGGTAAATNQVLYNLRRRGIEFDLLPWCRERQIPIMAYSPVDQGRLLEDRVVRRVALRRGVTSAQIALAWVLRQDGLLAIPKSSNPDHVRQNRAAADVHLTAADLVELDRVFRPPAKRVPLEML